jgi:hypothetical protein
VILFFWPIRASSVNQIYRLAARLRRDGFHDGWEVFLKRAAAASSRA